MPRTPSTSIDPSPAHSTIVDDGNAHKLSTARRYLLLVIFCLAQFLDAFNNTALFSAIPDVVHSLQITEAESTWLISAFQLTFASFLLIVRLAPLSLQKIDTDITHA